MEGKSLNEEQTIWERPSEADNSIHYTEETAKNAASDNPSASGLYNYLTNSEILNG
ncbi:hypothetical protein SAMN04487770_11939 [Butyrivibrio sp. ob235]|uniref:hypothetical protein n=1 Tax=Butyrivibrio sp. ob235 TaxID=1761780 RepID=UPI0008ACFE1C|nr:hypothetical protein [Butyrivibrio sp. ob235]SEL85839.1 hypothetical protein SAMN04487770_11939 [Butyrivibrio sp. ob235]